MTMTMTSKRGKIVTTGVLSLAVLISSTLGAGVANAATTPSEGTGTDTTVSEQALFDSFNKTQGTYQKFDIDPAVLASWAKMGFHVDLAGSVTASNAASDAKGFNEVRLAVSFNNAEFKANSPYASYVDPDVAVTDSSGVTSANGLGLLVNGGDENANMTTSALATKSGVRPGQLTNSLITTNNFPGLGSTGTNDSVAGSYRVGLGNPKSSFLEGGLPMGLAQQAQGDANPDFAHSDFPRTWITDSYTGNDALRNADISLDGAQRSLVATNYTDCSQTSVTCVMEVQPVAAGSHNGDPVQVAVGAPTLMTITSTRHKVVPTYTSEATAYTKVNGEKVWFTPINIAALGTTVTMPDGKIGNVLNPDTPIVPQDPAAAQLNLVKPRISLTDAVKGADGNVSVVLNTDGYDTLQQPVVTLKGKPVVDPSYQADVVYWEGQVAEYNDAYSQGRLQEAKDALVAATAAAPESTSDYTLTLSNQDAALQATWTDNNIADYKVGQTFGGTNGTVRSDFTVLSNANGVVSFDVSITDNDLPLTTVATVTNSPTIETALAGNGWSDSVSEPGYAASFTSGTPVVIPDEPDMSTTPTEPTPVIPEEPTGDSGNTPVAPPTGDSSSRPFVNIGNTSAYTHGDEQAQAVAATETGNENNGLIGKFIAGGLVLMGGLVLALRKKMRMVRIEQ